MDNALAIIGFYFTLIGFISGLFFTRLDGWYGDVRKLWGTVTLLEKEPDKIVKSKEARVTLSGLLESAPRGSFIAIGALTSALTLLSLFVPVSESVVNPLIFLRIPLIVTVLLYWIGGIVLLQKGGSLLDGAARVIAQVLPG